MYIGSARASTHDQTLALQHDALQKAEYSKTLNYVWSGDTFVIWRLGRSLPHLIATAEVVRNLIWERTTAGLSAARARGRRGSNQRP